ncbi:MAG TPA: phosphate acyltransferase PlsX [Ruminococcaceae bacterium]|nr:phosphate acyltransferase PlsX [Oscillospiraceae bacterium]HBQ47085.1 phosphate acyltransferase PlsX [Oscillospiraceae bacterium]HBT90963.1 phosphate acyltransferase PlsX [Oscillospiraceae bacterium]HCB91469.1 phosphate acyltransferase PlsX [Oscillospiraceae bacterium]
MKIIVDAFGGDNAPLEILKGCALAVQGLGIDIALTGREAEIRRVASENGISLERMEILDAPGVLTMEDSAGAIMKDKSDSSMAEGLRRLAAGYGDAFVSGGNSGALVVGATLIVKRIRGIKRIAFAPIMPSNRGRFMLIDCGANVDCKADMLRQFGVMGSIYMKKVMGIRNPRVALANVGTEDHKGGELQHEAFALLRQSGLNFIGNIEARDIPEDAGDVIVADGFTGNVILKTFEGVALMLMGRLKKIFLRSPLSKLAAAIVLKDVKALKKQFDYNEYGGAPLMGCARPVFKTHGSAKAKTVYNAIRLTKAYVEGHVAEEIADSVAKYRARMEKQEAGANA